MSDKRHALLRRGDGLYEPLEVYLDYAGLLPERIVLSVTIEDGCVPLGSSLPERLVVHKTVARHAGWWRGSSADWICPLYEVIAP